MYWQSKPRFEIKAELVGREGLEIVLAETLEICQHFLTARFSHIVRARIEDRKRRATFDSIDRKWRCDVCKHEVDSEYNPLRITDRWDL